MRPQPNLPLYTPAAHPRKHPSGGHLGLWFFKFFDQWNADFGKIHDPDRDSEYKGGKQEWLLAMPKTAGDRGSLEEYAGRMKELVKAGSGSVVLFETQDRFAVGLGYEHPIENGVAFHPTLGVPYVPGSSVKGLVRSWVEQWADFPTQADRLATLQRIFGSDAKEPRERTLVVQEGSVIFLDAVPTKPVTLEPDVMTPHYGPWYASGDPPADWHNPVPIPFLAVAKGASFQFGLLPRAKGAVGDVGLCAQWLELALEMLGVGAKTAVGYGHMGNAERLERERQERVRLEEERKIQAELDAAKQEAERAREREEADRKRKEEEERHKAQQRDEKALALFERIKSRPAQLQGKHSDYFNQLKQTACNEVLFKEAARFIWESITPIEMARYSQQARAWFLELRALVGGV